MGFFIVLLFPLIMVLLAALFLLAVILVGIGSSATALAVGGFAGSRLIKDTLAKKLTAQTCAAVLVFGAACFVSVGILLVTDAFLALAITGFVLGAAVLVLGIIGIVRSPGLRKTAQKILFIVIFSLITCAGIFTTIIFGISTSIALL